MKINAFFPLPLEGENYVDFLQRNVSKEEGELYLVCAEYQRPGTDDNPADFKGLDIALTLDSKLHPIIFCSFMPEHYFLEEFGNKFRALMAQKRTCFMRLPFLPVDLENKYKELIVDDREVDTLAIELHEFERYQKEMGYIEHTIGYLFRSGDSPKTDDPMVIDSIKKAREIGVVGDDKEVLDQILNFKRKTKNSVFAGRYFKGIFCDVEGTLIKNNEVNDKVLKVLQENAEKKPITLWTGGDLREIEKVLLKNNITWKLVSKNDFTGAEVETVYDDEEFWLFYKKYQIKPREFIQVQ